MHYPFTIKSVKALKMPMIEITLTNNETHICDLSEFKFVKSFPKNQNEWEQVRVDPEMPIALVWSDEFDVHMDQLVEIPNNNISA